MRAQLRQPRRVLHAAQSPAFSQASFLETRRQIVTNGLVTVDARFAARQHTFRIMFLPARHPAPRDPWTRENGNSRFPRVGFFHLGSTSGHLDTHGGKLLLRPQRTHRPLGQLVDRRLSWPSSSEKTGGVHGNRNRYPHASVSKHAALILQLHVVSSRDDVQNA